MVIIELHSVSGVDSLNYKKMIWQSFQEKAPDLLEKVDISISPDTCMDNNGNKKPYIRIYTSSFEDSIIKVIKSAGIKLKIVIVQAKIIDP